MNTCYCKLHTDRIRDSNNLNVHNKKVSAPSAEAQIISWDIKVVIHM